MVCWPEDGAGRLDAAVAPGVGLVDVLWLEAVGAGAAAPGTGCWNRSLLPVLMLDTLAGGVPFSWTLSDHGFLSDIGYIALLACGSPPLSVHVWCNTQTNKQTQYLARPIFPRQLGMQTPVREDKTKDSAVMK